jgi:hypothetical protein
MFIIPLYKLILELILPLVIEIFVSFRSFRYAPLAKRHTISITRGRSPGLSQERMSLDLNSKYISAVNRTELITQQWTYPLNWSNF